MKTTHLNGMQTKHLMLACIYHATMRPFVSHYLGFLNFQTFLRLCGWHHMHGIHATDKHHITVHLPITLCMSKHARSVANRTIYRAWRLVSIHYELEPINVKILIATHRKCFVMKIFLCIIWNNWNFYHLSGWFPFKKNSIFFMYKLNFFACVM